MGNGRRSAFEGDKVNISIEGVDGVVNNLNGLVSGGKLKNALSKAGEIVRADAASNCPVDSGRLSQSITSQVEGDSAVIGTNVEYGIFVEFGTGSKGNPSVSHTTKKSWTYYSGGRFYTTSGQSPQPFLVPALKNNVSQIIQAFKEAYK